MRVCVCVCVCVCVNVCACVCVCVCVREREREKEREIGSQCSIPTLLNFVVVVVLFVCFARDRNSNFLCLLRTELFNSLALNDIRQHSSKLRSMGVLFLS